MEVGSENTKVRKSEFLGDRNMLRYYQKWILLLKIRIFTTFHNFLPRGVSLGGQFR